MPFCGRRDALRGRLLRLFLVQPVPQPILGAGGQILGRTPLEHTANGILSIVVGGHPL